MRTLEQWMAEYHVSHQHPQNQLIHKICVPAIMFSVVGFFWTLPWPAALPSIPWLNWATVFVVSCLSFYFLLSLKMFTAMFAQTALMLYLCKELETLGLLLPVSVVVFVVAWIGQFYGHKLEGRKPSFLQDLAFLLIGPLWVTRFLFQKLGLKV